MNRPQLPDRWIARLAEIHRSRRRKARGRRFPAMVECAENRVLLTALIVPDGDVSGLAAAIVSANADKQVDTIVLAQDGTYDLTTVDNMTDGPNGLPVVTSPSLTIEGDGAPSSGARPAASRRFA